MFDCAVVQCVGAVRHGAKQWYRTTLGKSVYAMPRGDFMWGVSGNFLDALKFCLYMCTYTS